MMQSGADGLEITPRKARPGHSISLCSIVNVVAQSLLVEASSVNTFSFSRGTRLSISMTAHFCIHRDNYNDKVLIIRLARHAGPACSTLQQGPFVYIVEGQRCKFQLMHAFLFYLQEPDS